MKVLSHSSKKIVSTCKNIAGKHIVIIALKHFLFLFAKAVNSCHFKIERGAIRCKPNVLLTDKVLKPFSK